MQFELAIWKFLWALFQEDAVGPFLLYFLQYFFLYGPLRWLSMSYIYVIGCHFVLGRICAAIVNFFLVYDKINGFTFAVDMTNFYFSFYFYFIFFDWNHKI